MDSGSDPPAVHPSTSIRSAGVRRGCVGVVPDGARAARDLAEWQRITGADRRPDAWRGDRHANLLLVRRSLLRHADREQLLTRPGHDLIAAETGLGTKTIARRIDDMHLLGWLVTTEVGTTERIRAGRLGCADPHTGNRAQEYRLTVPTAVAEQVEETTAEEHEQLTVHPSRSSPKESKGRTPSRRKAGTSPTARVARAQQCHRVPVRPHAAGKPQPRPRRPARRPAWQARLREVTAVWQALPPELTQRLAGHETDRLAAAIAVELTHRSVAELADRIARHWAYWRYKLAADLVRSPIAVAHRIVRRDFDCVDVRCEDQWQLDTDQPCAACQDRAQHVLAGYAAQTAPHSGVQRPGRPNPSANRGQAACGAHSAPPIAELLPAATIAPGTAERGAALARRLLRVRKPTERDKIIEQHQGNGLYTVKAGASNAGR